MGFWNRNTLALSVVAAAFILPAASLGVGVAPFFPGHPVDFSIQMYMDQVTESRLRSDPMRLQQLISDATTQRNKIVSDLTAAQERLSRAQSAWERAKAQAVVATLKTRLFMVEYNIRKLNRWLAEAIRNRIVM